MWAERRIHCGSQLAGREMEVMRGGASDLYGSSAIGGVIDVLPVEPGESLQYALNLTGAQENTSIASGPLAGSAKGGSGLGATTLFRTGGYVLTVRLRPRLRQIALNITPDNSESDSSELSTENIRR
jgi:outer membrane receptor protein involved in Fe transport